MRVENLYLKVVLTVIAIALVVLAIRSFQAEPVRARPTKEIIDVNLRQIGGHYVFRSDFFPKQK